MTLQRLAGLARGRRELVLAFVVCVALTVHPTYGAALSYGDDVQLRQAVYGIPGTRVKLSFGVLDNGSFRSPFLMSNIVFNGRYFVVQRAFDQVFSQGQFYLNNYDSDVPLKIHFPTGARAFGAFFSSWIGP